MNDLLSAKIHHLYCNQSAV